MNCKDMPSAGPCPISSAIALIGGKWKLAILYNLREQTMRFSELKKALSHVTQKMLTQQLRELERDGLLSRKVFAEVPPKVEYSITPIARKLEPILALMCAWGKEHRESRQVAAAPRPAKIQKAA
jgi:DNA-binding HxlR family transcriptional regulator